jgi:hypothetical protein
MVAFRTIRTLLGLDDWPALTPGQTVTVDGSGEPVAMDISERDLDGGNATSVYGGTDPIDCGGA